MPLWPLVPGKSLPGCQRFFVLLALATGVGGSRGGGGGKAVAGGSGDGPCPQRSYCEGHGKDGAEHGKASCEVEWGITWGSDADGAAASLG